MPKITDLTAASTFTDDDVLVLVDSPGGTPIAKKITAVDAQTYFGSTSVARTGGGKETVVTANTGTSYTINLANGNAFDLTLTGNVTYTLSGATASVLCSIAVIVHQDATGSRTQTFPASVKWIGVTPAWGTTASKIAGRITLETVDGGTTWLGYWAGAEQ